MKQFASIACLSVAAVFSCNAIDLTPHPRASGVADATAYYYFQDVGKKMGFRIDPKTSVDGGASSVTFQFVDLNSAAMTIAKSSMTPDSPFQGEALKKYQQLARAALPGGSTNVVLESEEANPISINDWTSYRYVFTCNFYGVRLRKSVTFLNFNKKEQWVITIGGPVNNYDKAYARGYGVINSIYPMKPGEESAQAGT